MDELLKNFIEVVNILDDRRFSSSRDALAKMLCFHSVGNMESILSGNFELNAINIMAMQTVYNVEPKYLFTGMGEMFSNTVFMEHNGFRNKIDIRNPFWRGF